MVGETLLQRMQALPRSSLPSTLLRLFMHRPGALSCRSGPTQAAIALIVRPSPLRRQQAPLASPSLAMPAAAALASLSAQRAALTGGWRARRAAEGREATVRVAVRAAAPAA